MLLDITIQADSDNLDDLNALAALIASLGGRVPGGYTVTSGSQSITVPTQEAFDALSVDRSDADESTVTASLAATDTPQPVGSTDSTGLPHDKRIHSDPPTTTQDGKWRKRRGVDEALVASVTAELRQRDDTPTPPTATAEPVTSDVPPPPVDTAPATPAATSAVSVPEPGPQNIIPADTPTSALHGARYANFGAFVQAMNGKPGAVYQKLNDHAATLGVADFKSLKDRPDMWDMFFDSFEG